ncbi:hypothetical protein RRG08_001053 [Elysia crispata]|uniref:Uncharacterized protein n=1 Tax=Elysia crispata TaxID=231223 RepID=A0AAE1AW68_9GAST|nr:hypothetical protein RRG08_001053 [Elysia crispata]
MSELDRFFPILVIADSVMRLSIPVLITETFQRHAILDTRQPSAKEMKFQLSEKTYQPEVMPWATRRSQSSGAMGLSDEEFEKTYLTASSGVRSHAVLLNVNKDAI